MAFRATNVIPGQAYTDAKHLAVRASAMSASFKTKVAPGTGAQVIIDYLRDIVFLRDRLQTLAQTPGIVAYAQAQENDILYDVAAQFSAMIAAINEAINWINTALPKDGGGYLLIYTLNADGSFTPRQFTTGQVSALLPLLQGITDAVE